MHAPDTCIDIGEGLGLEFSRGATCKNGTKAAIAGFKGKGCDPTSEPLDKPFTVWSDMYIGHCIPTTDIRSMTFWCDGVDGVDMTKPRKKSGEKSNLGLILGLTLGLGGGLLAVVGGLVVAYNVNWHFRSWVQVRGQFMFTARSKQTNLASRNDLAVGMDILLYNYTKHDTLTEQKKFISPFIYSFT
jgi:hypothetical protein